MSAADDTMTQLRDAARECPILAAAMHCHELGHWTLEEAMTQAALRLAQENKRLMDIAVQQAMLRPSRILLTPVAP